MLSLKTIGPSKTGRSTSVKAVDGKDDAMWWWVQLDPNTGNATGTVIPLYLGMNSPPELLQCFVLKRADRIVGWSFKVEELTQVVDYFRRKFGIVLYIELKEARKVEDLCERAHAVT